MMIIIIDFNDNNISHVNFGKISLPTDTLMISKRDGPSKAVLTFAASG